MSEILALSPKKFGHTSQKLGAPKGATELLISQNLAQGLGNTRVIDIQGLISTAPKPIGLDPGGDRTESVELRSSRLELSPRDIRSGERSTT